MRIQGKQLFWMMAVMQAGMTILLTINPALQLADRDAWMSVAAAGGVGVWIAFVCSRLSLRFPNQTFAEYAPQIFGKWAGQALVVLYLFFWYGIMAIILRQYAEFVQATILPHTPVVLLMLAMLLVSVYAASGGIEVIARCSELFGPLVLIGIFIPLVMTVNSIHINNLLPVFADSGLRTLLVAALPTSSFLGDCVMLIMLYAFVNKGRQGTRASMWGVGTAAFLTCASTFLTIVVFGGRTSSGLTYPYFNLIRYVSYFDFIQNLDSFVITLWIVSVFVKVSLYFFICTYGTAQLFRVKRWKRMIWVVLPIALGAALIPKDFMEASVLFPQKIAIPYILPFYMFGMPAIMWAVAALRHVGEPARRKN